MLTLAQQASGFAAVNKAINSVFEPIVAVMASILFFKIGPFPLIVLTLMTGAVCFTFYFKFINVRGFKHSIDVIAGKYDNPEDEGQISHFQALTSALSATIGLGNIAGVAVAMSQGGPGALFWMAFIAVFGMTAKFVSACLAQLYRQINADGTVSGGPMYYLSIGLKEKGMGGFGAALATIYAVFIIGGALGGGNMFQANQSFELLAEQFPAIERYGAVYGLFLAVLVGAVIIGGIERIGAATSKVVPLMVVLYVGASLVIIFGHASEIPGVISNVISQAFNPATLYSSLHGGMMGVLVIGIQRAVFSNEAGVGSAAIAHSAAKTDEPIREGMVAMIGPFIDTILICSLTAMVLLVTLNENELYQNYRTAQEKVVAAQSAGDDAALKAAQAEMKEHERGAALTASAFGSKIPGFEKVLTVVVFLFSYSTMISWYYYGEKGWGYLFGLGTIRVFQGIFLCAIIVGSVAHLGAVLDFSDLMILSCAFPNIIGAAFLLPVLKEHVDKYWSRYQAGQFKVFK